MAILDNVPGVTVQIHVNGQPAAEHHDEDTEDGSPSETSVFIQSETGAEFKAVCIFAESYPYIKETALCHVTIDGELVEGRVWEKIKKWKNWSIDGVREKNGNQWFTRKFAFSQLHIVERHPAQKLDAALLKKLSDVGTISVKIYRVRVLETYDLVGDSKGAGKKGLDEISEKALKGRALSHGLGLKPPQTTPNVQTSNVHYLDSAPVATFIFKYRSRVSLKALSIIPRSPSPVPLERRPVDELTLEEARQLARQLLQKRRTSPMHAAKREVKMEAQEFDPGTNADDDDELSFVKYRPAKRRRTSDDSETTVEVVDLT